MDGSPNQGDQNPSNLALYTYAYHNPATLTDPTGRQPFTLTGFRISNRLNTRFNQGFNNLPRRQFSNRNVGGQDTPKPLKARKVRLTSDLTGSLKPDSFQQSLASLGAEYSITRYRDKAPGMEQHHGVPDIWLKWNVSGYSSRAPDSPTIQLSIENHALTKKVYRDWLEERTGKPIGGKVDWTSVHPREIQTLTEQMFDAAGVPEVARRAYYSALHQYLYDRDKPNMLEE